MFNSDPIKIDGRKILFGIPSNYDTLASVPVVVAFHGLGSKAEHMLENTGLKEKAESDGFVLVCPDGQRSLIKAWNAGTCCGIDGLPPGNDINFVKSLLDAAKRKFTKIDENKIFLTGMSNGAMLAHRLAHELSQTDYKIAAMATVSGTLAIDIKPHHENYPIPIIHFHGSVDNVIPTSGSNAIGRTCKSVADTITIWRARSRTKDDSDAVTETINNPAISDGTSVVKTIYPPNSADGAQVVNVSISGGGHTWPGHDIPPDFAAVLERFGLTLGPSTRQFNAEELIWQFFSQYT